MQTCTFAVSRRYEHVQLEKPAGSDFVVLTPAVSTGKPVLVFWDVADDKVDACAETLRLFFQQHKPRSLMVSGPLERNLPGIERLGAQILRRAMSREVKQAEGPVGCVPEAHCRVAFEAAAEPEASPEQLEPAEPGSEPIPSSRWEPCVAEKTVRARRWASR